MAEEQILQSIEGQEMKMNNSEQPNDSHTSDSDETCEFHTPNTDVSFDLSKDDISSTYITEDCLIKHIQRQSLILSKAITDIPISVAELSYFYELNLFSKNIPRKLENGTCEPNPNINFYPCFIVPEVLATYHIFFQNYKIPLSCKANRSKADDILMLKKDDTLPTYLTLEEVPKIFEGLGREEVIAPKALEEQNSALIELKGDNPRLAVVKRTITVTHFAYPALNLPPKVMNTVMETLLMKTVHPQQKDGEDIEVMAVSNEQLAKWLCLSTTDTQKIEEKRKTMMSSILVSVALECMHQFFTDVQVFRKIEENLHYMFRHGYVKQACEISQVELTNIISYMGILHENRLGQSVLHNTLKGEARRDYIRDTIYLYLVYTWQTAMGVWQQCLETENLKFLEKMLEREKKNLWTHFNESTTTVCLAKMIFPEKLCSTLKNGLPDFTSQSMIQNFRNFILERSGILPCISNSFPTDFIPLFYKECPPPLWGHTYLLRLANYFMFHTDIAYDLTGDGLMSCYCRCNLCSPHRSLIFNNALLNETQTIGTFELQGPPKEDGTVPSSLKLTPAVWTSAYLRKFIEEDYHPSKICFFEDQSKKPQKDLTACVITQSNIITQLQEIKKARDEFLVKKGHGIYLDPITGEELNGVQSSTHHNAFKTYKKSDKLQNCSNARTNNHGGARFRCGEQSGQFGRGGDSTITSYSSAASCPQKEE
ncbi:100K [Bat mastadenovirus WIV12]|uniref:Shutoff protein n=1 Tax=Bat mastadenovirus WIV12 TaxID=1788434 RepID=A0A1B0UHZ9_9ADEN|nr:100K [Bat mastadenovirus WIV12]AMB43160.1 100K [Bat mastadenovirus WIV12]